MLSGTDRFSGVNARASRTDIVDSQLARSINADLHETVGTLRLRNGRATQFSPALSSALYSLFRNPNSATRYQAAGTTFYRTQVGITDYRNQPLSGNSRTGFLSYKPLNDSIPWTFAADRGVMQKDDGTVCRRWGLKAPDQLSVMEDDTTATLIYSYRFGLTEIRYDGTSVGHESNPSDTTIGADRDTAGDKVLRGSPAIRKRRTAGRRDMYLNVSGPGLCKLGLLDLWVTDGVPDYHWSATNGNIGDLKISVYGDNNERARVTFVGNRGSDVAGTAYRVLNNPNDGVCTGGANYTRKEYGCNSQLFSDVNVIWSSPCCECETGVPHFTSCSGSSFCGADVVSFRCSSFTCDLRSQGMKDAECRPCEIVQATDPAVVTVVDDTGRSISATVFS